MVTEHNTEWQKYRQQLILKMQAASKEIEGVFGDMKARVNGKVQSARFQPADIASLLAEIESEFVTSAGSATEITVSLVENAAGLAHAAGTATDKAVFGASFKTTLGSGAPEVAAYLKKHRYSSGFKLSDNLWPSDKKLLRKFYETVENGIKQGAILGQTVKQMAELKQELAPESLPKYLKAIEQAARRAAKDVPGAYKEYTGLVHQVKRQLAVRKVAEYARPVKQGLSTLGTRRATELFLVRLDKAIGESSLSLIEGAVEEYLEKRAIYHSTRAARTMAARAFKRTGQLERKKKKWVIGEKWTLSASHPRFDECDLRAMADFGQGPGVYPKGQAPDDHVHGLCYLTDVIDEDYFERDEPLKPKWKKGTKQLIDDLTPGSPLCKYVNSLGRAQNAGRVAQEFATAGPYFNPHLLPAVKANVKQLTLDEVREKVKAEYSKYQKAAREKAMQTIQKVKPKPVGPKPIPGKPAPVPGTPKPAVTPSPTAPGIQPSPTIRPIPSLPLSPQPTVPAAPRHIPTSVLRRERDKMVEQTRDALRVHHLTLAELEKKAQEAVADYAEEKAFERHLSGFLKDLQAKRTLEKQKTVEALEAKLHEAQKKLAELKQMEASLQGAKAKDLNPLFFDDFEQIGPQRGSNPGGLFKSKTTGESWYIKFPQSTEHARNEALAADLYQQAGVKVPEVKLVYDRGRVGVASKIIDGLEQNGAMLAQAKGAYDGFAVDAWLANWDVVGLNFDNMLIKNGMAYRVDTGGALLFRAQGMPKGAAFGNIVEEWNTFRTVSNFTTTQVFKDISEKKLIASANKVLKISDKAIRDTVRLYGFDTDLATLLIERKRWIKAEVAKLKPKARPRTVAKAPLNERLTREEYQKIIDARGNGYAVRIDKDEIEDQQILFWREQNREGTWVVSADFKVRGRAVETMAEHIRNSVLREPMEERDAFFELLLRNVKGIRYRINQGQVDIAQWDSSIFERFERLLRDFAGLDAEKKAFYQPWIDAVRSVFDTRQAVWDGPGGMLTPFIRQPRARTTAPRIQFVKKQGQYVKKDIRRGTLRETDQAIFTHGYQYYYEARIDGVTVRYWGDEEGIAFANRRRVQIVAPDGMDHAKKILDTVEKLGLTASRATVMDAEELYLNQIAYSVYPKQYRQFESATQATSQEEHILKMKTWLSREMGTDITKLPDYNPEGAHEFWGDGKVHRLRPDLQGPAWEKFKKDYLLYHRITADSSISNAVEAILNSGGKMIPTTDKLRRGIPWRGMSPASDMKTGGANYFFTRIKHKRFDAYGFFWKVDHLKRLDSISYDYDKFGDVRNLEVITHRKSSLSEFKDCASMGNNETIFKDGLSLFDKLDKIVVPAHEREAVIEAFRRHGYAVLPDGRPIEEVVRLP